MSDTPYPLPTLGIPNPKVASQRPALSVAPTTSRKRRFSDAAAEWPAQPVQSTAPNSSQYSCSNTQSLLRRRLSTSDTRLSLPSPLISIGPRKQAVSDPLPRSEVSALEIDEWFISTFESPPMVPLDPLSIDLYSDWTSIHPTEGGLSATAASI